MIKKLQHLFKVENGKQKEKAMAPLQFYKDIIPNAIKNQNKFLYLCQIGASKK